VTAEAQIEVNRMAGSLGAEIKGADLAGPVDEVVYLQIRQALLDNGVVCIRDQQAMTPDDQLAFAALWGEISIHPYIPSIDGYPGIMRIHDPHPLTQAWHSDTTHMSQPPDCTILLARILPPVGGDTMFASATSAFEQLSEGLQATLRTLSAVHEGTDLAADAGLEHQAVVSVHPVVRTHPETGAGALFVNDNYVTRFDGWTEEESAPLLHYLYSVIARPENTYRHRWQEGDMLIWDNRCAQHAVVGDVGGAERELHRITIKGENPV
jgi:taurine dioxygenase